MGRGRELAIDGLFLGVLILAGVAGVGGRVAGRAPSRAEALEILAAAGRSGRDVRDVAAEKGFSRRDWHGGMASLVADRTFATDLSRLLGDEPSGGAR